MTKKKRFIIKKSTITDGYCIFDTYKEYVFTTVDKKAQLEPTCKILNILHEENQKLLQLNRNQGYLIYQLHEQLLYRLSEEGELNVILTPENLELMGKAISYYEHNWSDEDEK